MKKHSVKYLLASIFLIFITSKAIALDFLIGDKVNPIATKGYKVQSGDTFGGYSIYAPEGDWSIFHHSEGHSTLGVRRSSNMPSVGLERYMGGKWVMGQWITVTTSQSGGQGWEGDPCAGNKIIKINIMRGQLDRCSTAEIQNIRIASVPTDTLKITFIETNDGGRYYRSIFNIHYENLGFNYKTVTDQQSEFNNRLKEWMGKFLDGVVKAATFEKPGDTFKGVPVFTDAINNLKPLTGATSVSPTPQAATANNKNILEKLQTLKDLFDKKLITEDDYNQKRKDVLNSL